MKPQRITTDLGEELVVLGYRDDLALLARAGDEGAEDEMTVLIAAERQRAIDEGVDLVLPGWFAEAAARGNGSVLRGLRDHRARAQDDIARAAGLTLDEYRDIERGAAVPTAEVLDRISAVLDLDPAWLRRIEGGRVAGA
ncbi:helix-turn-helix domain-containing protein [Methylobacterium oryzisoli]|uniref:helix-turn-helix domain-containing protein n=1 Tax=Methylobacterium oryzisoli TaxID=3385502 RepID=UPI0038926D42